MNDGEPVTDEESLVRIEALLSEPARELVEAFYVPEAARVHSSKADFIGELFTTLGDTNPGVFQVDDLVAVHLMGMRFTPTATRALLKPGSERDEVSQLLSRIPQVDIWDERADFSAANEVWQLLRGRKAIYRGIDWVTAGKLLARKRPGLIPVIDEVVTTLIPRAKNDYWPLFQAYLRDKDRYSLVESLRPKGVSKETTPTLRLLDTAIWMRGSGGPAKEIRSALGLTD